MGNRIFYYLRQALYTAKKSFLIIIAFSITLSLVSALGLYSHSYNQFVYEQEMNQLVDFLFKYENEKINQTDALSEYDSNTGYYLKQLLPNVEDLELYGNFYSQYLQWYNFETYGNSERTISDENDGLGFNCLIVNPSFFETTRFSEYFNFIEGTFPTKDNEILIDYAYLEYFNASVGQAINLTIRQANPDSYVYYFNDFSLKGESVLNEPYAENSNYKYFNFPVNISGIYSSKYVDFDIGTHSYSANYELGSDPIPQTFFGSVIPNLPVFFSGLDFFNLSLSNLHPLQQLTIDIEDAYDNKEISHIIDYKYGVFAFYNRQDLPIGSFASIADDIEEKLTPFRVLSENKFFLLNYLSYKFEQIHALTRVLKSVTLFLSIPLTLLAIILASYTRKIETEARMEEYLLLRSKGTPPKMLLTQYICESLFLGFSAFVLGVGIGLGIFYLFQDYFHQMFNIAPLVPFTPVLSWDSLETSIIFSILTSLLGSLSGIKFIAFLPTNQLIEMAEKDNLDPEYDEKSLYAKEPLKSKPNSQEIKKKGRKKRQNNKIKEQKDLWEKLSPNEQNLEIPASTVEKRENTFEKFSHLLGSKDVAEEKQRTIKKFGKYFILISIFPLCIVLIVVISRIFQNALILQSIVNDIQTNIAVYDFIFVFGPFFLCFGIIRLIVYEKPKWFAKLTKFVSTPFLKDMNYVAGVEMVKQKQYKSLILILGVFISMFSFLNLYMNSSIRNEVMFQNYEIGSDFQTTLRLGNANIANFDDVKAIESQITTFSLNSKQIFKNVVSIYKEEDYLDEVPDNRDTYFLDVDNYLNVISDDGRVFPESNFKYKLSKMIPDENNFMNPKIIVNSIFLERYGYEIGDQFNFTHTYLNYTTGEYLSQIISAEIVEAISFLPGIYTPDIQDQSQSNRESFSEIILMDYHYLNQSSSLEHSREITQMVDVSADFISRMNTTKEITNTFLLAVNGSVNYKSFQYCNFGWDTSIFSSIGGNLSIYYTIYIDFLFAGILLSFGISIMVISIQKENSYFNGILLARGIGKKRIVGLILFELLMVLGLSLILGLFSGFILSYGLMKLRPILVPKFQGIDLVLNLNYIDFFTVIGLIVGLSLLLTFLSFRIQAKQKISSFIKKF